MSTNPRTAARAITGPRAAGFFGILILLTAFIWVGTAQAGTKDKEKTIKAYSTQSHGDKGYLGIKMQELDDNLRKGLDIDVQDGVLISEVMEGSPAAEAGIQDGDVIVEFNGEKVDSPETLQDLVAETESGKTVEVKVLRGKKMKTYDVTIGDWPEDQTWGLITPENMMWLDKGGDFLRASFGRGRLGVNVTDLNEDLASYFDAKAGEGVLVTNVVDESTADEMGIKAGDVIVEVDDESVGSTGDLIGAVQEIEPGKTFDVTVVRKKRTVKLEGTMQESPATAYVKALKAYPHKLQMPHFRMQEKYEAPDAEMKALKKEMQEMREEMEKMKRELKKVDRRAR